MFNSINIFAVKYRFRIISARVVATPLMPFFTPSLSEVGSMKETDILPKDSESRDATILLLS